MEPLFDACVKCFAQDLTQVGDRILVVLGEHAGIISCIQRIHDNVTDIVTQSPEEHSGLVIGVVLHGLMPHFLADDHVQWAQKPLQCLRVLQGGGVALGGVGMALGVGGIGESTFSWLPNKLLIT